MRIIRLLVVAAMAFGVLSFAGTALADPSGGHVTPPIVKPKIIFRGSGPSIEGTTITNGGTTDAAGSTLPFTGSDLALFVVIGAAAIGTGTYIVRRTRTQRAAV